MLDGPSEVLGLISANSELFLFENKVAYNRGKAECWLQGVESNMQETIGKLINYAVNTFPKQSLDEWILDYPQQIILTTIHLILTHEINELFEEYRQRNPNKHKHRRNKSDMDSDEEDSEQMHDQSDGDLYEEEDVEENVGLTMKTPDTRDLIKQSQASQKTNSQHVN